MPSVTNVQQTSSINEQKSSSTTSTSITNQTNSSSTDGNNFDGITQSILILEKKQRNLGKRKEKLESYQQDAQNGKELNKDQREALAKYPEVIGQIECVKELLEQMKKIQTELKKQKKQITKQMVEEKRLLISQRLQEYIRIRFILDNRPKTLNQEESNFLDNLSSLILPSDNLQASLSRSVDSFMSIYEGGQSASIIKAQLGKTAQEIRDLIDRIASSYQTESLTSSIVTEISHQDELKQEKIEESQTTIHTDELVSPNFNDYPLQFDTRNQTIPLECIMQNSLFLSNDTIQTNKLENQNHLEQKPIEHEQYLLSRHSNHSANESINQSSSLSLLSNANENPDLLRNDQDNSEEQWQQTGTHSNNPKHYRNNHQQNRYQYQQQTRRNTQRDGRINDSHPSTSITLDQNLPGNQSRHNHDYTNRPRAAVHRGGNHRGIEQRIQHHSYYRNGNHFQRRTQYHHQQQQQQRSTDPSS